MPMTNILELINSGVTGITLNVTPEDLLYLVKQTIEATKNELLPVMVSAAKEALLTKQEVMEKFGVCHTTLWNWDETTALYLSRSGRSMLPSERRGTSHS